MSFDMRNVDEHPLVKKNENYSKKSTLKVDKLCELTIGLCEG
jgi:hypothetical protein